MPICPTCGAQSPEGAAFCDECGASLQSLPSNLVTQPPTAQAAQPPPLVSSTPVATNCPVCGAPTQPGAMFCENCGASLASDSLQSGQAAGNLPPTVAIPGAQTPGEAITAPGPSAPPEPPSLSPSANPSNLTCANCGAILEPDSAFCDMCGAPVKSVSVSGGQIPTTAGPPDIPGPTPETYSSGDATVIAGYSAQQDLSQLPVEEAGAQQYSAATQVGDFTPPPVYQQPQRPAQPPSPSYKPSQSDYAIPSSAEGRLVIPGTSISLPLTRRKANFIVGRVDPIGNIYPDIDLTDYGGDESGVSRQHARITLQGNQYYITDLQSTNYTYVNQQRLSPNLVTPLHDGDEIRFGMLKMIFYQ
jgi:pSer/pThr/pTyr-binding forkhead associated (FHA) protein